MKAWTPPPSFYGSFLSSRFTYVKGRGGIVCCCYQANLGRAGCKTRCCRSLGTTTALLGTRTAGSSGGARALVAGCAERLAAPIHTKDSSARVTRGDLGLAEGKGRAGGERRGRGNEGSEGNGAHC